MLILFGVALSAFGSAADRPGVQPVALAGGDHRGDGLAAGLGGEPRLAADRLGRGPHAGAALGLSLYAARGLSMMTLGEETAGLSGLPMARLRTCAVAGASLLAGAAVALAGIIGFVGLAAPHLVRQAARQRARRASCRPRPWPAPSCWSSPTSSRAMVPTEVQLQASAWSPRCSARRCSRSPPGAPRGAGGRDRPARGAGRRRPPRPPRVLDGVGLTVERRRGGRRARPQRRGQDHPAARGARPAAAGGRRLRPVGTRRPSARPGREGPAGRLPAPGAPAGLERRRLARRRARRARRAARRRARHRARRAWPGSASPTWPTAASSTCRAASGRGCCWRACSPPARRC